jgi:hypothetical protein
LEGARRKEAEKKTPNAQRPTPNVELQTTETLARIFSSFDIGRSALGVRRFLLYAAMLSNEIERPNCRITMSRSGPIGKK